MWPIPFTRRFNCSPLPLNPENRSTSRVGGGVRNVRFYDGVRDTIKPVYVDDCAFAERSV